MSTTGDQLDRLCRRASRRPEISGLAVRIRRAGDAAADDYSWTAADARPTHFVASSTKLAAAMLVLARAQRGDLDLDQPLTSILPRGDLVGLNRFGGIDHADALTVRHVVAQTSGIPDYYAAVRLDPRGDVEAVTAADPGWEYEQALEWARGIPAPFAPNTGRALYSGTNYQLVGRVLETASGLPLAELLRRELLDPLGMAETVLLTPDRLDLFEAASPLLVGTKSYRGARRLASLGAEGALLSSTADMMTLLDAVFAGRVVGPEWTRRAAEERLPIFPRVDYGLGMMALHLPRILTGLPRPGILFGHAGMTGHLMFADPVSRLRVVMAVNQLGRPRAAFGLLSSVLRVLARQR